MKWGLLTPDDLGFRLGQAHDRRAEQLHCSHGLCLQGCLWGSSILDSASKNTHK